MLKHCKSLLYIYRTHLLEASFIPGVTALLKVTYIEIVKGNKSETKCVCVWGGGVTRHRGHPIHIVKLFLRTWSTHEIY